jgi:hypothetical protein
VAQENIDQVELTPQEKEIDLVNVVDPWEYVNTINA